MPPATLDGVLSELRRRSEPVPRPRSLPTESEVRALEDELGLLLPADLRRYLLEASDVWVGVLSPVTIGTGDHTDMRSVVEYARDVGVPDDLLPVCADNGDFYCLAPSGEVVFWSHNGATDERWADLATWIDEVWIHQR